MRRTRPRVVAISVAAWLVCLVAPALAKDTLLAGGGGGGVCHGPPPDMDAGWVGVIDNCFAPTVLEVSTGDVIRWRLLGQIAHTVTFDEGADAGVLHGDGFAVQFNAPGTYHYRCTIHPGMVGSIEAVGPAVGAPPLAVVDGVEPAGLVEPAVGSEAVSVLHDSVPMRVEFSPLAAVVILTIGLPLSLGLATRLVGFAWIPTGSRRRIVSAPSRAPRRPARR